MNQEETAFTYLWEKFLRLSETKLKEGVFIVPQIWGIIKAKEKAAWDSFKFVVKWFFGNRKAQNHEELVDNLLQSYQKLGCNMSLKIQFLHSHLDFFSRELRCSERWTRRKFRSTHFFNGEEISREIELCYARRLLVDYGKRCPYHVQCNW